MVYRFYFFVICILLNLAVGCSVTNPRPVLQQDIDKVNPKEIIKAHKVERIKKQTPPLLSKSPRTAKVDIIEEKKRFSLSFDNVPFGNAIKAITCDSKLNLSLESEVDLDRLVTVHLNNVSFQQALDIVVAQGADYAWKIEDGCLQIKRFEERTYHFDYLDILRDTEMEVGGDMLSSSVKDIGVIAKYQVKGKKTNGNTDVWSKIENSLKAFKSTNGLLQVNRLAGIIYMADTPRRIGSMVKFLDSVSEALHRQVFIEAKIFEVKLSDDHKYGIDWSELSVAFTSASPALPDTLDLFVNGGGSIVLSDLSQIAATVDFLQTQGDLTVLSNPHLAVMNGQSAVMTVGYQFPFGDIDGVDRDDLGNITYGTSIKRAILGLQLGITPQISNKDEIILHIVPSITKIQGNEQVEIPVSTSQKQTISNPVISLQAFDTTVMVGSRQSVVLAGLISQTVQKDHEGLPWLSKIPYLGNLFKHVEDKKENQELVIFITPYIKSIKDFSFLPENM